MVYKKDDHYETDMRWGLVLLACILAVLLTGCNCTAGSDAITKTICTTDSKPLSTEGN